MSPKRARRLRRALLIVAVVVLLALGGAVGYAYYLTHSLKRVEVHGLSKVQKTGHEAGAENILMVGSTSRCALKVQNPAYGLCSEGVNGVNGDVIMILHVDPATHHLALLSIPRDLFIPNARNDGAYKIDAGLVQGLSQMVTAIEEDFGIPIQHAISLNFDQFANIVNALGGINMTFPESVFDAESGLNIKAAACVHLDGTQALQLVRARHLQYDAPGTDTPYASDWPQEGLSDLARIQRDHEFLRVLATTVAKRGLGDPITDFNLINSVKADITFDQTWSVGAMVDLVREFHSVAINAVPQLTLPVAIVYDPEGSYGGLVYEGYDYGDVEFPSQPQDESTIDRVLGISPTTFSMTGKPLPSPASISVSVVNGSGVPGQESASAAAFKALGFRVVGTGSATPTGDVVETIVYYGSRSPADEAAAEEVAHQMTGSVIMAYGPHEMADGAQVTVVTGTKFAIHHPATKKSTTVTQPTGATSSAIETPSPSNPGLAPWDPRACPAGVPATRPKHNIMYP